MFGQHYVKTGIFPTDASKLYIKLQTMREKSDYNCVYVTTADEMQPLFEPVREFIAKVGNQINEWLSVIYLDIHPLAAMREGVLYIDASKKSINERITYTYA